LVCVALSAPAARAEANDAAKAQAQAALREGNALLAKGRAVDALAKFKSAYALFPSPKLHYNVGQAESLIPGHEAQAFDAMSRFLSQAKDANPDLRAAAEKQRQQLRSKVGLVTVAADPASAQLVVDGVPVDTSGRAEPLVLGIGVHALTLRGDGGVSAVEQVVIAGGETKQVQLHVAPPVAVAPRPAPVAPVAPAVPSASASAAPPAPAPPPPAAALQIDRAPPAAATAVVATSAPASESWWTTKRTAGAALAALGVASLVFGVIEHVSYFNKADEFRHHGCGTNDLTVGQGCQVLNDDFNSAKTLWIAGYAGAVALGGAGAYLLWPSVEPASRDGGATPAVSSLTINLAARF
jgi:hypothetical protein